MSPATNQALSASQKRLQPPDFEATFSLAALGPALPLRFRVPEAAAPSPKRHYRSAYRYLGYTDLEALDNLETLTDFELALGLIDFTPLRDYLAQPYYVASAKGQAPYDPVSLFLSVCLRRELNLSWDKLAKRLAGEHGAGWRRRFGFEEGVTPSASGLRYLVNTVGQVVFDELCPLCIDMLQAANLLPQHTTLPGDVPTRGVSISHDIMLHTARSNRRCTQVTDSCYAPAPRPCPATQADAAGCACDTPACAQMCQRTTPLDPAARSIYYSGRNKRADVTPESKPRGQLVYGYASNPDRLLDDRFACAWTLRTNLVPANGDERVLFPLSFAQLRHRFPDLEIGEVLADAALGYQCCLDPIWEAGALRMVDTRAAENDDDAQVQLQRGYNQHGQPVCVHGYPMAPNGHDYVRRRTKWCCRKVCLRGDTPPVGADDVPPAPDCPFLVPEQQHGQIVNVGRTLPDGSLRLAREVPVGSDAWKTRYGRRNLSESRNGSFEAMGLKRLPCCGLSRGRKEIALADLVVNLRTLGRLVRQASRLAAPSATA